MSVNWDDVPFGEEPDAVISERLGVPRTTVRYQRVKRGIAPATSRGRPADVVLALAVADAGVGKMPDADVAAVVGCSAVYVREYRKRHGIEPFAPKYGPGKYAPGTVARKIIDHLRSAGKASARQMMALGRSD